MSGTYPTSPSFEAVNFKINTPTLTTRTNAGQSRRVGMGHSFYTFTVKHPNMTAYDAGPIHGFVAQQRGPLDSFEITLPEISFTKLTSQVASATASGGASDLGTGVSGYAVGVSSITVTVPATGNVLRAGDYFKFANHSKVYMCTSSLTVSSGTTGTLNFSGGLVEAVPNTTALTLTSVPFTVILEGDVQQYEVGMGGITTMSLDMRETW